MALNPTDSDNAALPAGKLLLIAVMLILIWGTAFTMTSVGVRTITPIWLVTGRCILGAVLVTAWAYSRGHRLPPLTDTRWVWYFVLGLIGMVAPFYLFSRGQIVIDSGMSAIIAGTMPLMTIIMAHFFVGEYLNARKIAGFIIGFIGLIILFLPDDFSLALIPNWKHQLFPLGGAFCYALTTIIAKRAPQTPAGLSAAMMVISATIMAVIGAIISGAPVPTLTALSAAMVVGLGTGATGIAAILYLFVIQKNGPSTIAKINYFPPVVSVVAGVVLLGEPFSWRIVAAFAIILAGLLVARSKPARGLSAPQTG